MGTLEGWTTRRKNQARTREVFEAAGAAKERARLRPLLERCLHTMSHGVLVSEEAHEQLLADLRRELGMEV